MQRPKTKALIPWGRCPRYNDCATVITSTQASTVQALLHCKEQQHCVQCGLLSHTRSTTIVAVPPAVGVALSRATSPLTLDGVGARVLLPWRVLLTSWPNLLLCSSSMVRLRPEAAHRLLDEALLLKDLPAATRVWISVQESLSTANLQGQFTAAGERGGPATKQSTCCTHAGMVKLTPTAVATAKVGVHWRQPGSISSKSSHAVVQDVWAPRCSSRPPASPSCQAHRRWWWGSARRPGRARHAQLSWEAPRPAR